MQIRTVLTLKDGKILIKSLAKFKNVIFLSFFLFLTWSCGKNPKPKTSREMYELKGAVKSERIKKRTSLFLDKTRKGTETNSFIQFDRNGQVLDYTFTVIDRKEKWVYLHDKNGNIISAEQFWFVPVHNADGSIGESYEIFDKPGIKTIFTLDNDGFVTEWTTSYPDGRIERVVVQLDNKANLIEKKTYKSNKLMETVHIKYNENGQKEEIIIDGTSSTNSIFKYDERGFIIEKIEMNEGKSPVIWTYKYEEDKHGNWIHQTHYRDGVFDGEIIRKFEYFD